MYLMSAIAIAFYTTPLRADVSGDPEKISGWVVAYETDSVGSVERGTLKRLLRAMRAGADVKVMVDDQYVRTCDFVEAFSVGGVEHLGCQSTNVALVNGVEPIVVVRSPPYLTYEWIDTRGQYGLARASVYGGADLGRTAITLNSKLTWFARVR